MKIAHKNARSLVGVMLVALCQDVNALTTSRRHFFGSLLVSTTTSTIPSLAVAETIGKDENCRDASCLGVWDGLLADCPHNNVKLFGNTCVSSQDDTPGIFAEPWDYSDFDSLDWEPQMDRLVDVIQQVTARSKDETARVVYRQGRYLRVAWNNKNNNNNDATGEFYFTPNDTTVQFRITSNNSNSIQRAEELRKSMSMVKLPVLRNRKRSLFFVESNLDTFGPGSAALGPPAEMKTGELEGRFTERDKIDPKLPIDFMQNFPLKK